MPSWIDLYYQEPIELASAEGRTVHDAEGNTYLDFFGGILTVSTGYNVPEVVEAIQQQAARMLHTSTLYLIRPMIELAEQIAKLSTIPDAKVFFVTSGTEAVETALMLACTARASNQIFALRHSYHGRSFAALAVTGNRAWSPLSLTPFNVNYLHNGGSFRNTFGQCSESALTKVCVDELREIIDTATTGNVACMIAEPIQGVGGFVVPPDGFFKEIKQVLDEHGIYFVSDEVQTGWGRTGENFWGFQAHDITPDLITFAKGLGNGLAIGGVVGRGEIVDALNASSISTFGGNPLASAGALANLNVLLANDLQSNARQVGSRLLAQLRRRAEGIGIVGEIRGKGLMVGVELIERGTTIPNALAARLVLEECKRRGILIGKGGLYGNILRISPPMSVSPEEADTAVEALVVALREVDRVCGPNGEAAS